MPADSPVECTDLDVFLGTYDNYVFSYHIVQASPDTFAFQRSNVQQPHSASVRHITTNGHLLASAGADDRIVVVDLRRAQEIQLLTHHTGTVNRVAFTPDGSHLFSAADDGQLAATKTGSWLTDNVWRTPHSGKAIQALALHPSGKLALTLGRDGTLRTWNLIKGRQCFTTNLRTLCSEHGDTIETVIWSPAGSRFALIAVDRVLVMAVGSAAVEREWLAKGKQRTTALCWLDEDRLLFGQESGHVRFVSVDEDEERTAEQPIVVHENRVKDMALQGGFLVTMSCTSTAGALALWRLDDDEQRLEQLCTTALGRRPICLAVADARTYRPETAAANSDEATDEEDENAEDVPAPVARKIVSTGRVTIENDDDDVAESLVTVLKTPKAKKAKKTKADFLEEEVDEEVAETPKAKKSKKSKNLVADEPTPTKKSKKAAFVVEPEDEEDEVIKSPKQKKNKKPAKEDIEPSKSHGKKNKRILDTAEPDEETIPIKKSKKKSTITDSSPVPKSKKLNRSINDSNTTEKPKNDRRKSSKW